MRKQLPLAFAAAATAMLAGCGSSSYSSSSNKTTASSSNGAATTAASSTSSSSNPYGAGNTSSTATTAASAGVAITTKHSKFGTILAAGPKRLTVYLFEGDKGASSACSGACASAWPPVTTAGSPSISGAANAGDLGTITRSDGTKQVTYKGHPLYFFSKDKDDGDAYGEGSTAFGAGWYVLEPSGKKVDKS